MGIFTKRDIKANEELTFNYNVDRYGYVSASFFVAEVLLLNRHFRHLAQECYCGELNCVGYIGGKTQTELAGMDDLYLDGESFSLRDLCS